LVLIAGIIAVRLVGKLIEKSAELMLLGLVNKFLGILVMAIIYGTFFAVTLVYCNRFGLVGEEQTINSKSASYLMKYGHWLVSHFSEWMPALKNLFKEAKDVIKQESQT
jgi:uncharacterized membrane protein required for colicin V production